MVGTRTRHGWSTILLLALAYGIVEEAFATQSLFNPNFVGQHLLEHAYLPVLGIGGWWTPFVLTLHTVWSISVPIALVEALARAPWLVGVASLVLVSAFLAVTFLNERVPWLVVAGYLVVYVAALALSRYWSASPAWGDGHRLALAGSALLAYAWYGFPQPPSHDAGGAVDLVGNAIFAAGAVSLLAAAVAALRLRRPAPEPVGS